MTPWLLRRAAGWMRTLTVVFQLSGMGSFARAPPPAATRTWPRRALDERLPRRSTGSATTGVGQQPQRDLRASKSIRSRSTRARGCGRRRPATGRASGPRLAPRRGSARGRGAARARREPAAASSGAGNATRRDGRPGHGGDVTEVAAQRRGGAPRDRSPNTGPRALPRPARLLVAARSPAIYDVRDEIYAPSKQAGYTGDQRGRSSGFAIKLKAGAISRSAPSTLARRRASRRRPAPRIRAAELGKVVAVVASASSRRRFRRAGVADEEAAHRDEARLLGRERPVEVADRADDRALDRRAPAAARPRRARGRVDARVAPVRVGRDADVSAPTRARAGTSRHAPPAARAPTGRPRAARAATSRRPRTRLADRVEAPALAGGVDARPAHEALAARAPRARRAGPVAALERAPVAAPSGGLAAKAAAASAVAESVARRRGLRTARSRLREHAPRPRAASTLGQSASARASSARGGARADAAGGSCTAPVAVRRAAGACR